METTIPLWLTIYILLTHLIADFGCQTRNMANNKSESIYWLTMHILAYGGVLTLGMSFLFIFNQETFIFSNVLLFLIINMALHWVTDYFTSKGTSYFWGKELIKKIFFVIGLDQFIHTALLLITIYYFLS